MRRNRFAVLSAPVTIAPFAFGAGRLQDELPIRASCYTPLAWAGLYAIMYSAVTIGAEPLQIMEVILAPMGPEQAVMRIALKDLMTIERRVIPADLAASAGTFIAGATNGSFHRARSRSCSITSSRKSQSEMDSIHPQRRSRRMRSRRSSIVTPS